MSKQTNKKPTKPKVAAARTSVKAKSSQSDGIYLLKLTLFALLGLLWVKVGKDGSNITVPIPLGFIIGIIYTAHEHFQIDRKIEYAVLLTATLIGFIAPIGLYITL